jgi:alpha-tubulin suppressor-like RCC1 family protein
MNATYLPSWLGTATLLFGLLLVVTVAAVVWARGRFGRVASQAGGDSTPTPTPRVLGLDQAESELESALHLRRVRRRLAGGVAVGAVLAVGLSLLSWRGEGHGSDEPWWAYHPSVERPDLPRSQVTSVASSAGSAEREMAVDPVRGTRLIAWSGSGQSGDPGRLLRGGLAAVLQDSAGRPIPGAEVRFIVAGGGGRVEPELVTTSDMGLAVATWWLGADPDSLRVTAHLVSPPGLRVEFTAMLREETGMEPRLGAAGVVPGDRGTDRGDVSPEPPEVVEVTEATEATEAAEVADLPAPAAAPATIADARRRVAGRARAAFTAGGVHTCRLVGGEVFCWGGHEGGSSGGASTGAPPSAPALRAVSAGLFHSCGVTMRETVYCWPVGGPASGNQAGLAGEVALPGGAIPLDVVAGAEHSCALSVDGDVYCWGSNTHGQLGNGTTSDARSPVRVAGLAGVAQLAGGWLHTCALTSEGRVYCWGSNGGGQIGDGGSRVSTRPTPVEEGRTFTLVTAGSAHSCALTEAGQPWCWGSNEHGQLGTGPLQADRRPRPVVGNLLFRTVAAGGVHTCGLTRDGTAWCWGRNTFGQLGNGTNRDTNRPSPVEGGRRLAALEAGGSHTCGETVDGQVFCWGNNVQGQVGDGTRNNRNVPVAVVREALR